MTRSTPSSNRIGRNRMGPTMNRKRVIVWMTVAVVITLVWLTISIFDTFPPWPVVICFGISHAFFCIVVWNVQPFRGPYTEPTPERSVDEWKS
jgi:hypothetical protein